MTWQYVKAVLMAAVMFLGVVPGNLRAAALTQVSPGPTKVPPPFAVSAQMQIDGFNGNNPTPIASFSVGAASSVAGGGGAAGKVTFADLVVNKMLDADSVPLLQAAATGQIIKSLSIQVFTGNSNAPLAIYTFEDVSVVSTVLGSSTSAINEQDAFDYRRITSEVTVGGQTFRSCFDIKANAPCS